MVIVAVVALQAEERFLTRSLHVPIQFDVCEHIQNAVLYEGEQAVALLPNKRIYQFTYYPSLQRMEPRVIQIRVEGTYVDGNEPFIAQLAITPDGVHAAHKQMLKDVSKEMKKFRFKRDVHRELMALKLHCKSICSTTTRRLAADLKTEDRQKSQPR
jgi:hypothetical protein